MTPRVLVWLMAGLGLMGTGCDSIYQHGPTLLPPDPCAQLARRMQEARAADKAAEQGSAKLRDRLAQGLPQDATAVDMDRVHAAVLELERRVASARDAATRCPGQAQVTAEIDRLQQQSRDLLDLVESALPGVSTPTTSLPSSRPTGGGSGSPKW